MENCVVQQIPYEALDGINIPSMKVIICILVFVFVVGQTFKLQDQLPK